MMSHIEEPREATQAAQDPTQSIDLETPKPDRLPERQLDWKQEISDGLNWLHGRAWPVGGAILFLSVLCLHHYATAWGVSLSITSTNLIAALPSMLVLVISTATVVVLSLMAPTMVLFTPLRRGAPTLFVALTITKDG